MRRSPLLPFVVGLAAIYVAERTLADTARWLTNAAGALLVAAGFALALWRLLRVRDPESRKAAAYAAFGYVVALVALGLYAVQASFLGGAEDATARTLLMVAWPFVLLLGLAPALAIELALASMAQAPTLELWRVKLASRAAHVVVYAIVVFAGLNFAASQWNRKLDLSYLRTTEPSAATLELVRGLGEPVRAIVFSPAGNEVMDQAHAYLRELARASPLLELEVVDQALVPELARELRVRQNGVVALARGGRNETLQLGLDMEKELARKTLRNLDAEVQERLLKLSRPPRTLYFTTGHMERDYSPASADERLGLGDLRNLSESLGFRVKRLGLGEGLGTAVPDDAGIVVVAGPSEPFLPAERDAIRAYLERGGRLLALIDPDTGVTEDELLAPLGVRVTKALVASDRATVRIEGRGESPYVFATTRFSSHPSSTTLGQNAGRLAAVFMGAGSIEKREDAAAELRHAYTVHSLAETWVDTVANGRHDEGREQRSAQELAIAVERVPPIAEGAPEPAPMRAVVIADADALGNGIIRNPGNTALFLDALKWLAGEEKLAGPTTSEEDVPIVHKREDDALWFYGPSLFVPAAVLALGLVVSRRSRTRRSS